MMVLIGIRVQGIEGVVTMMILAQPAWRVRAMVGDRSSTSPMSVSRALMRETLPRKAVAKPMVADRATRTPHSGYNFLV